MNEDQQQQLQQQRPENHTTVCDDIRQDLSFYLTMLERLRTEPFNEATNRALATHPYLVAAKEGTLTLAQRRAFAGEQYAIQYSDACSFATLAGHDDDFAPNKGASLISASVPPAIPGQAKDDLFQFLLGGEIYASKLLLDHAKSLWLGLLDPEGALQQYPISARAQGYPSYWARLALSKQRGAGAAACAVNFPGWGRMCRELSQALKRRPEYGYSNSDNDDEISLAFIDFFGTPIENLDTMAASIMMQEGTTYEEVVTVVRLLQEYELMFWDAIYDAK